MDSSIQYAKENKKEFLARVIDGNKQESKKTAIFMAGAPGSGKTEVVDASRQLLLNLCDIDADLFRSDFPGYTGQNSSDFQKGAAYLVDYTFSWLVAHRYSLILDGTFSIAKSITNVQRAVDHGYIVMIYYVYQDPIIAWNYTRARERKEGRVVPADAFIKSYYTARKNVIQVKEQFKGQVKLDVFIKDFYNNVAEYLNDVENLSLVVPALYDRKELENKIYEK
ncbi:zeta toxin family protein [Lactiplantibacillus mudanjiangensis]|uniref:UDP-N-acetylglucosamine kinase n=1 Tax=Lactiplantibacillus mudanjiangensis TaxID=1296538 RepID=A0A660ECY2_9LACO|nr:zeta toxin family protein [Lactiplantibacillus mudanjiangensis]VDG24296.1 zeta toxin family protein [Lactobacillus pentosus] [Lactiplantibacillus mudanjiangensis]VDG30441.1 zeta toxin family protein [Lactobacillus pentosus] [Lactiplantibacillus mudanjiangensis]